MHVSSQHPSRAVSRHGTLLQIALAGICVVFVMMVLTLTTLHHMRSSSAFQRHHPRIIGEVWQQQQKQLLPEKNEAHLLPHHTANDEAHQAAASSDGDDSPASRLTKPVHKRRRHFDMNNDDLDGALSRWRADRGKLDSVASDNNDRKEAEERPDTHTAQPTLPPPSTDTASEMPVRSTLAPRTLPPLPPLPKMPGAGFVDRSATFTSVAARRRYRRQVVIDEIEHSFAGYANCAWGADEVRPVTCRRHNWEDMGGYAGPGLALTLIDSLTTLYLANLTEQWSAALNFVERELTFDVPMSVSVFETLIRGVGGLISAYEVSGETHDVLLRKARDLADRLLQAFDTPTGIPHSHVHLRLGNHSNAPWHSGVSYLAELGTNTLELRALSYHSRDPKYAKAASRVSAAVSNYCSQTGLCRLRLSPDKAEWEGDEVSIGGLGDSYYEYLLKAYIQSGFEDQPSIARFLRAAASIYDELVLFEGDDARRFTASVVSARAGVPAVHRKGPANLTGVARVDRAFRRAYVAQMGGGEIVREMDHLACFAAGTFELAYHVTPWDDVDYHMILQQQSDLPSDLRQRLRDVAIGLGQTCHDVATMTQFKLPPEVTRLESVQNFAAAADTATGGNGSHPSLHVARGQQPYLLRPEAFESFFYLAAFDLYPQLLGPGARVRAEGSSSASETTRSDASSGPSSPLASGSVYEEHLWKTFVAIIRSCKVTNGYSGVLNVMQAGDEVPDLNNMPKSVGGDTLESLADIDGRQPRHNDIMESFWIAETLKYALLTFSLDESSFDPEDDGIGELRRRRAQKAGRASVVQDSPDRPLNRAAAELQRHRSAGAAGGATASSIARGLTSEWVLNTEAHPLRIRTDMFDRVSPF